MELFYGRDTSKIYQSVELDLDTETLDGRTLRDAIKSIDGIFIYTWWYKDIKEDSSAYTDYYINCILTSTNDRGDVFLDIPLEVQNTIGHQDAVYLRTTFYYTTKDKLISLDRLKDFLGGCKNIFHTESDLISDTDIEDLVKGILNPEPTDLQFYARDNIADYETITEIPQQNLEYLNSGLLATNIGYLFYECQALESVPQLNIDTSNISDIYIAFLNIVIV